MTNEQMIINTCAEYFKVRPEDIDGKCRKRSIATARHIASYLIRENTSLPLKSIGWITGKRDHTTVIHSLQVVEDLMETDKIFKRDVLQLELKVKEAVK